MKNRLYKGDLELLRFVLDLVYDGVMDQLSAEGEPDETETLEYALANHFAGRCISLRTAIQDIIDSGAKRITVVR